MDPFIIAAIISAIVIVILSIAFLKVGSQVKPNGKINTKILLIISMVYLKHT